MGHQPGRGSVAVIRLGGPIFWGGSGSNCGVGQNFRGDRLGLAVDANRGLARFGGGEAEVGDLSGLPLDIDDESPPCPQSPYRALGPRGGQGGQEMDFAGVTLEQHFADAGGVTKASIDLKGGVGTE